MPLYLSALNPMFIYIQTHDLKYSSVLMTSKLDFFPERSFFVILESVSRFGYYYYCTFGGIVLDKMPN